MSLTCSKYGDVVFLAFRKTEKLSKRVQKAKCDLEFLCLRLIYQLTPKFVKIKLWEKRQNVQQNILSFNNFA